MEGRMQAVRQGDLAPVPADPGADEIGRLSQALASMTATVSDNTRMLEQMVEERTEELRRLAYRGAGPRSRGGLRPGPQRRGPAPGVIASVLAVSR